MDQLVKDSILGHFRNERYHALNKARWDHFLSLGISIESQWIFEPGAGIGDQTQWLLDHGAALIDVNDGRADNLEIIRERFGNDKRVSLILGDLETCLAFSEYQFYCDLIFCYGVYYHLREDSEFTIMRQLAGLGEMIVFDYLAGNDSEIFYGYENQSGSISQYGLRPRPETMAKAVVECWGFAYVPKEPLVWLDPVAAEDRRVMVGSHSKLDNPNLIQI